MIEKDEKHQTIPSLEDHHYFMFNKDFTSQTTGDAIEFILRQNLMDQKPPIIKFILNSYGGEIPAAFALIDIIRGSKIPIYTYGLGVVASCGLMTFIAGESGHRYISKNTDILSHQYSAGSYGKEHELFSTIKEFDITSKRIIDHYKKCTGLSEKKIKEILLPPQDVWLTAKEAVRYGLADKIIEFI